MTAIADQDEIGPGYKVRYLLTQIQWRQNVFPATEDQRRAIDTGKVRPAIEPAQNRLLLAQKGILAYRVRHRRDVRYQRTVIQPAFMNEQWQQAWADGLESPPGQQGR